MRCEGWRRYGGAFTFGPPQWVQCHEDATVLITHKTKDGEETTPGCNRCWEECIENNVEIIKVVPIPKSTS